MKKFVVSEESSLKNFTDNVCAQASFCFRALLKAREIRVNGVKVGENVPLRAGDEVCYYMTPAQEHKPAFSVVYEDENILVADKESGVNSEAVFSEVGLIPVHRLDRNTEGLLLFARTKEAEEELLAAFRDQRVEKVYHALVLGAPEKPRSVEDAYLIKDEMHARVKIVASPKREERGALPIRTEYEVLERRGECTLLKITLHTGRTHQIRAHLAFLGYPVVGDGKYGDAAYNRAAHLTRQKLLAKQITLHTGGVLAYLDGRTFRSQKSL